MRTPKARFELAKHLRAETGCALLDGLAALELARDKEDKAKYLLRMQGTCRGFPHSLQTEVRLRRLEARRG
jgi:hypothetical protein